MRAALFVLALAAPAFAAAPATPGLAPRALAVLEAHCHKCHGKDGSVEGGLNFILDREKLVARRKIVPGDPAASPLLKRVLSGRMPPATEKHRPSPAEVAALREWIAAGAPALTPKREPVLISEARVQEWVLSDLETLPRRERRFTRYFSLVPLANAGAGPDELRTQAKALTKLLNSLSWHPRIRIPEAVGPGGLLLRIDLRDLVWDSALWNRVLLDYPYGVVVDTAVSRAVLVNTATRLPVVRADWFVATASRAPMYYDLLQMPGNLGDLEKQLRVDSALNIQQERVARAGFNGSGVSRNNRVLERHDAMNGAYWRSYDFEAVPQNLIERNLLLPDRRNIFAYPLGPGLGDAGFQHAGGEAIFNLPNGLQAYYLVNANNQRINKGPTEIVSDARRPDRAVEAGLSCMHCHATGILPKDDQIAPHVRKNRKAFARRDADLAEALYVPPAKMRKLMEEDAKRHRDAVEKTGNKATAAEVVLAMTLRHEADVDLATLAAEVGVKPEELSPKLTATENLSRNLGALKVAGATVSRQVVVQAFGDLVKELRLGVVFQPGVGGENLPDGTGEADPLEALSSPANAAAFTPDRKLCVVASNDRSVRIIDVQTGRDLRRCVGHTASVWAVAVSPDGTQILSGGKDGTVRLWEVETARELAKLEGHLDLVSAVAFSPDGKKALSASYDGEVILWDLARQQKDAGFAQPGAVPYPHAADISADGKTFLVSSEKHVLVMEPNGRLRMKVTCHHGWVTSARFVGNKVLSTADDGSARLWDAVTGKEERALVGHTGPVLSATMGDAGVLTCGADATLRLWEGKPSPRIFRKHEAGVVAAVFSANERFTLSVSRDAVVHPWAIGKGKTVPPPPVTTEKPPDEIKERPALRPEATFPVGGNVGRLLLTPDGKWLFYLDRTSGKVGRLDAPLMRRATFPPIEADEIELHPEGGLAVLHGGKLRRVTSVAQHPPTDAPRGWSLAAGGNNLFVGEDAEEWGDVFAYPAEGKPSKIGTAWRRSSLKSFADGKSLFVSSNGVVPGTFERWTLQPRSDAAVTKAAADKLALGGGFELTADGKFAVLRTGAVLRLGDEITAAARVEPHLAAAVDVEGGRAWLLPREGGLAEYSYPDWRERRRWRLPLAAYAVALDAKGRRLYVAGFDARSAADRPRAKGHGDIHAYDLTAFYKTRR